MRPKDKAYMLVLLLGISQRLWGLTSRNSSLIRIEEAGCGAFKAFVLA